MHSPSGRTRRGKEDNKSRGLDTSRAAVEPGAGREDLLADFPPGRQVGERLSRPANLPASPPNEPNENAPTAGRDQDEHRGQSEHELVRGWIGRYGPSRPWPAIPAARMAPGLRYAGGPGRWAAADHGSVLGFFLGGSMAASIDAERIEARFVRGTIGAVVEILGARTAALDRLQRGARRLREGQGVLPWRGAFASSCSKNSSSTSTKRRSSRPCPALLEKTRPLGGHLERAGGAVALVVGVDRPFAREGIRNAE